RVTFTLERRAARLQATVWPERPAALLGMRVEVLDRAGMPSLAPTKLRIVATRSGVTPAETTVTSRDGVAWAYLRLSRAAKSSSAALARVSTRGGSALSANVAFAAKRAGTAAVWSGWARSEPDGAPLREPLGTREPAPRWSW